MVKSELAENISERADMTLSMADGVVSLFFDSMVDTLKKGGRVEMRGFGSFRVKDYQAYLGRNPRTGEKVEVPAKKLPFWKTGQELKQRVDATC